MGKIDRWEKKRQNSAIFQGKSKKCCNFVGGLYIKKGANTGENCSKGRIIFWTDRKIFLFTPGFIVKRSKMPPGEKAQRSVVSAVD